MTEYFFSSKHFSKPIGVLFLMIVIIFVVNEAFAEEKQATATAEVTVTKSPVVSSTASAAPKTKSTQPPPPPTATPTQVPKIILAVDTPTPTNKPLNTIKTTKAASPFMSVLQHVWAGDFYDDTNTTREKNIALLFIASVLLYSGIKLVRPSKPVRQEVPKIKIAGSFI